MQRCREQIYPKGGVVMWNEYGKTHEDTSNARLEQRMKVYIITSEPYHDNGYITDVFDNLRDAVQKLKHYATNSVSPNSNYDDYRLTEWNLVTNAEERVWDLLHQGGYKGPHTWELANPHNKWERVDWPTE